MTTVSRTGAGNRRALAAINKEESGNPHYRRLEINGKVVPVVVKPSKNMLPEARVFMGMSEPRGNIFLGLPGKI